MVTAATAVAAVAAMAAAAAQVVKVAEVAHRRPVARRHEPAEHRRATRKDVLPHKVFRRRLGRPDGHVGKSRGCLGGIPSREAGRRQADLGHAQQRSQQVEPHARIKVLGLPGCALYNKLRGLL